MINQFLRGLKLVSTFQLSSNNCEAKPLDHKVFYSSENPSLKRPKSKLPFLMVRINGVSKIVEDFEK